MYSKLLLIFSLLIISAPSHAETVSETLISLQQDGRSYVQKRTLRSARYQYDFFVEKSIGRDDFLVIDPAEYTWIEDNEKLNQLHFNTGSFSVTYAGVFNEEVTVDKKGVFTFNSWDQKKLDNGHFGQWNLLENFNRFVYTWVFPDNMEIIDYKTNRVGEWVHRPNSISLLIMDDNDITITLRYREKDADNDSIVDRLDRCPGSFPEVIVDSSGCETDDDKDGVINRFDKCLSTVPVARVDESGCELDSDNDGVPDRLDECVATKLNSVVDKKGCELDSDFDGVINRFDSCLDTPLNALVDKKGCELDFDGDGIVNSKDKCSHTLINTEVDLNGCIQDLDKDSVFDSKDKCPATTPSTIVDATGCPLDSDKDGVADAIDKCPNTAETLKVDLHGCEVDSDVDGIVDSRDQCPSTPEGTETDSKGCAKDSDLDGVIDSKDECPATLAGVQVDSVGCQPDADRDGVVDTKDLCANTTEGEEVDSTGCVKLTPIVLEGVIFKSSSAELTQNSVLVLDEVAESLLPHKGLKLEVAGHTDASGSAEFNLTLSQSRAETVLQYLTDKGVDSKLYSAKGYGESDPVADNNTVEGRAKNRRVELNRLVN